jgi:hypothetical protein
VESAFAQTYPHVEVWLSDDCSTDSTAEVAAALQQRFPQLRYHRHAVNQGISGNNNWLLSQPRTDFILRLDSDDVLEPTYLENILPLMEKYPRAGYGHGDVNEIDQNGALCRVRRLHRLGEYQSPEEALRAGVHGYRVAANICVFRREALTEAGFYRPGMNFAEDWDLSVRLADLEWGNVHYGGIVANYRVWEDAALVRPRRKRIELEGSRDVFEKTLIPAFNHRGWDLGPIESRRRAMAVHHAMALDSKYFSPSEREELKAALAQLGDSKALSVRLKMLDLGFGPILRAQWNSALYTRGLAKSALSLLRRS